jgi:hypothetical protein
MHIHEIKLYDAFSFLLLSLPCLFFKKNVDELRGRICANDVLLLPCPI